MNYIFQSASIPTDVATKNLLFALNLETEFEQVNNIKEIRNCNNLLWIKDVNDTTIDPSFFDDIHFKRMIIVTYSDGTWSTIEVDKKLEELRNNFINRNLIKNFFQNKYKNQVLIKNLFQIKNNSSIEDYDKLYGELDKIFMDLAQNFDVDESYDELENNSESNKVYDELENNLETNKVYDEFENELATNKVCDELQNDLETNKIDDESEKTSNSDKETPTSGLFDAVQELIKEKEKHIKYVVQCKEKEMQNNGCNGVLIVLLLVFFLMTICFNSDNYILMSKLSDKTLEFDKLINEYNNLQLKFIENEIVKFNLDDLLTQLNITANVLGYEIIKQLN